MGQITTIGLDIAKSVFQVHGVDAEGMTVLRRRLTRARLLEFFRKIDSCRVGIEACAASHHWARELRALGHDVRLMPPSYVKPYAGQGPQGSSCDALASARSIASRRCGQKEKSRQHSAAGSCPAQLWRSRTSSAITGPLGVMPMPVTSALVR